MGLISDIIEPSIIGIGDNLFVDGVESTVSNSKVYGLKNALRVSGFPMRVDKDFKEELNKSLNRGKRLGKLDSVTGEDNYLCGVVVQFDLNISIKMWTEFQRYHFADIISSQSTMHKIVSMGNIMFDPYTPQIMIDSFNIVKDDYLQNPTTEKYLGLLMGIPCGLKLTAGITTNYRQLKTIYIQRYNHRLPQWREFCKWILTLPYFKELTGIKEEMVEDDK
nr:MAG TPA: hypothetical protein [Caudoviricetes sp.]